MQCNFWVFGIFFQNFWLLIFSPWFLCSVFGIIWWNVYDTVSKYFCYNFLNIMIFFVVFCAVKYKIFVKICCRYCKKFVSSGYDTVFESVLFLINVKIIFEIGFGEQHLSSLDFKNINKMSRGSWEVKFDSCCYWFWRFELFNRFILRRKIMERYVYQLFL